MTTAIRKTNVGSWAVVQVQHKGEAEVSRKLLIEYSGPGAKAAAIKRAGTNTVIA